MTRTFYLGGSNLGFFQRVFRTLILVAATIGGLFLIATSAFFAMIIALGLLFLGGIVFTIFWLRSKILGRPMSPYGRMRQDFEAQIREFQNQEGSDLRQFTRTRDDDENQGPVVDAHETPRGWSVDSD